MNKHLRRATYGGVSRDLCVHCGEIHAGCTHTYIKSDKYYIGAAHGNIHITGFEVQDLTGMNFSSGFGARLVLYYYNQNALQEENSSMTLLIPDRERDNREDFVWCVPIERVKWEKWYALSEKFKSATPKEHGGMRYLNRMEGKEVKTILMMPNGAHTDEDVMTACAYLRFVKRLTCRMYVVRCTNDLPTHAQIIARVAGADPTMVDEMEDEEDGSAEKEANS